MISLYDKFKSTASQNRKFFLVYLIVILVVSISLILLSILGNIERIGYLSEFKQNNENNYGFRISYYSKIFRHGDIYGVYAYFHTKPEYIREIEYQKNGSPFGVLISEKNLSYDDKIDVYYKLRIRYNLLIYILLVIILIPFFYFKLIKIEYLFLILLNTISYYLLIGIILPSFNMLKLRFNLIDIILSNIFLITAYHLYNKKILFTIIFFIFQTFSFFVIEPIALTVQNTVLLFSDIPILYTSLIQILSANLKIITIITTVIYFSILILLILFSIKNLIKMKKKSIFIIIPLFLLFYIFFRDRQIPAFAIDFYGNAEKNGIIDTIGYKIYYNRFNNKSYSKEEVLNALNTISKVKMKRDYTNLILQNNSDEKRDIFLIFLESFYDYSHFTNLFEKDPFPKEYREWANNSRKILPNIGGGSFYARLAGLTASSPIYPKTQVSKLNNTLPSLLIENGYNTLSLEEFYNTYNLKNFLPSIGFQNVIFDLGYPNIAVYLETNFNNLNRPIFVYGFTFLGHTGSHIKNNLNIKENNNNFFNLFKSEDIQHLLETIDSSVMTAIEVLKIRDTILEYSPNALIIFKHDHLYPYLRGIIENSSIEDNIKMSFLNDNAPTPILIWDGTNGAYKAPDNFVPENIPMFIALNTGVTNYENSIISLLYKEEIDGLISTYHQYYRVTNDTLILENNISEDSEIFKYENAQRILSQDIFQGKKHYYDLIKNITNN